MVDALVEALRERGCPEPTAQTPATSLRFAGPGESMAELVTPLATHGVGVEIPLTREGWVGVVHHLVDNVAADNAQAVDRTARGESGWTPLWHAPGRPSRS